MAEHHHIRRSERGRCWQLTVKRSPGRIRRSFHDRRYGTKAAALAAAITYRDRVLATIPGDWRIHTRPSSRNTSGIIGVCLSEQHQQGRVHRYWIAT